MRAFALRLLGPSLAATLAACVPATDLTDVPAAGASPPAASGPSGAALVDPAAGSTDVPVNLATVLIQFPGPISWTEGGLQVCSGAGAAVPTADPTAVACDGGTCYRAALSGPLPAGIACQIALGTGNADENGVPIPAGVVGVFDTAAVADDTPPVLSDVAIEMAGPCLAVSFSTDEPATGTVSVVAGGVEIDSPAGLGETIFSVSISLGTLPASTDATVTVGAVDRAGNAASSSPLAFQTPAALPPIAITEVLANPKGPEPAQEYVELRNLGTADVALLGLRIEDSKGGDDLPDETLAAGSYALVVSSGYDPEQGDDPPPRTGTLLARVDTRIGADGLSNGGETVKLVQGDAVVSSYGGWVDTSPGSWNGRAVHRLVQTACDRADAWNRAPLEPTPGWGPP